jgi:hypothetical protein
MTNRENCQYVCKRKQTIGQECGAHPFQVYTPERAGARPAPDATDRLAIALRAMRPPALSPPPSASASGNPGVPDSNNLRNSSGGSCCSRLEVAVAGLRCRGRERGLQVCAGRGGGPRSLHLDTTTGCGEEVHSTQASFLENIDDARYMVLNREAC